MSIRITGMFSGLDTESIISELVSAQSVKKNSLVKAQTKLSWKQDAWKALNTKIYSFYTNTLSDMRFEGSYLKKTTKVSNTNAISVITSDDAVDGVRSVKVDRLAKGARLTSGKISSKDGVGFTGSANLSQLLKHKGKDIFKDDSYTPDSKDVTGSFRVVGAEGQYVDFNVNENTTIDDIIDMIKSTGLNANFDMENQRIFISSKNTGELNNFNLMANDDGGYNTLSLLGLLSADDIVSSEQDKLDGKKTWTETWAAYQNADGSYTDAYRDALFAEIKSRLEDMQAANEAMGKQNTELADTNDKLTKDNDDLLKSLTAADFGELSSLGTLKSGKSISDALKDLYGDGGIYDTIAGKKAALTDAQTALADKQSALQKAQETADAVNDPGSSATQDDKDAANAALAAAQTAYDAAKAAHDTAKADYDTAQGAYDEIADFLNDAAYGKLVNKEIQGAENTAFAGTYYQMQDENGKALNVYEKLDSGKNRTGKYYAADGTLLYEKNGSGYVDKDGNALEQEQIDRINKYTPVQERSGGLDAQYEAAEKAGNIPPELKAKVDVINKLSNVFSTVGENKDAIASNKATIASNEAAITSNEDCMSGAEDDVKNKTTTSKLAQDVQEEFETRVAVAKKTLAELENNKELFTASKVNAQDAKILIDGAEFTSMTNTFSVNGLTLTAQEETDKEVTLTTSTDTDGIYNMIKNFFTEYNKLINEMDSMYNAESSKGYEPLLSEEKEALSDSEVEEWEKKIKDSILRRDSTLSSVSFSMASVLLQGAEVNGQRMYLSDFGINTLGYFKAKDNERNAYHIDGDPDDPTTKANDDVLKSMIASDPETVMSFFTKLSTNLYDDLTKKMAGTTLSSAMTVYNDKQMKSEYEDYTDKIKKQEEKLNAMMDKWYAKFSAMEVAMSKLESRSSSLASILGG